MSAPCQSSLPLLNGASYKSTQTAPPEAVDFPAPEGAGVTAVGLRGRQWSGSRRCKAKLPWGFCAGLKRQHASALPLSNIQENPGADNAKTGSGAAPAAGGLHR